ncbi:tumor necrosis factor receptor superfamily member 4-like isoform X2 [Heterodontus francisci]|uniref:tumor necrosis factor receptor superfamily member 4-like isoform X2 n=1 Tax=Heterodontus francisci TaxID=7792 RepID=UPI00355AF42E
MDGVTFSSDVPVMTWSHLFPGYVGYYLVKRCENFQESAKCEECSEGTYSIAWNIFSSCAPCNICSTENGATYKKKCERNSNAECSCGKGEQLKPGNPHSCEPCKPGFYSDDEDNKPCKPWISCEAKGQHLIKNGSRTEDAECGISISTIKTTTVEGRSPNPATTSSATVLSTSVRTPSVTTVDKPGRATGTTFYIGCIIVAVAIFLIVLIKRGKLHFGMANRDFNRCFWIKQDVKDPVQEESEDITSVQVKN